MTCEVPAANSRFCVWKKLSGKGINLQMYLGSKVYLEQYSLQHCLERETIGNATRVPPL